MKKINVYRITTDIEVDKTHVSFLVSAEDVSEVTLNLSNITYQNEKVQNHINKIEKLDETMLTDLWSYDNKDLDANYIIN